jgi:hypothetical protein
VKLALVVSLALPGMAFAAKSPGKPGAPVAFDYVFLGQPKAGQPLEIEVKLTPTAAIDDLQLTVIGSPRLAIEKGAGTHRLAQPQHGVAQTFVIRVRPDADGMHDLKVRAVTQTGSRSSMRTLGIAIPVGAKAAFAKPVTPGVVVSTGARPVVSLPAKTERRDR